MDSKVKVTRAIMDEEVRHEFKGMRRTIYWLCAYHLAPLLQDNFRERWRQDMIEQMFGFLSRHPPTVKACRAEQGDTEPLTPETLMKVLARVPACCRINAADPEALKRMYIQLGCHRIKRCRGCLQQSAGTPIVTLREKYDHVCFHCWTHNIDIEGTKNPDSGIVTPSSRDV